MTEIKAVSDATQRIDRSLLILAEYCKTQNAEGQIQLIIDPTLFH